ncbi:flagellar basal body-associated FliL family protein [Novosphingobium sp. MMS21-SN21R]|uniref:flagellar basal body-associated FliL family protein n=1 Tax=Novosphingobium sp. MMS21-SN21R TaxID=2969298 RepID=UPI002883B6F4|nr:flagellar basal body-associated FliL family protein [Novosphingobium sp. MMS21-SN21R]MDT0506841.1 flagellar basal body-associated FliL family protein [Novosphingobium sp. MMS21-SN21R]
MSDKEEKPKKKKGGGMMKILMPVGLLAVGGGGVFGLVAAGVIGGGHAEVKEDPNPKLIRKGEVDPYAPVAKEGEGEGGGADVEGEGGSEFRTVYYNFPEDFTSNLRDSEALLQVNIAASTRRDYRVILWMKKHELAIRSAVLIAIADTPEEDVYSPVGKDRLQKRLTAAINKVLTGTEGFGGVDAVYFKTFIVQ